MTRLLSILATLLLTLAVNAQESALSPKHFKATFDEMSPKIAATRHLTDNYYVELKNDSAFIHLPYVGEVYTPSYSDEGLNFECPFKDIVATPTKKRDGTNVIFTIRRGTIDYLFVITAYNTQRCDLDVKPSNAQSCTYYGEWKSTKSEPQKIINEIDRSNISYLALVLDSASNARLMEYAKKNLPWEDVHMYCHHMTIAFHTNMTEGILEWVKDNEGKKYSITAYAVGHSDKAFAVRVNSKDVPSVNEIKHVTMATHTSAGGNALDSNYITDWKEMEEIPLTGTVQIIRMGRR